MKTATARRVRWYQGVVYALGVVAMLAILLSARRAVPDAARLDLIVLSALLVAGELTSIRTWQGASFAEYRLSGPFALVLVVIGPVAYGLLAQVLAVLVADLWRRRSPATTAFALARYALVFAAGRLVAATVSGVAFGGYHPRSPARELLALLVAGLVWSLIGVAVDGPLAALSTEDTVRAAMYRLIRAQLPVIPPLLGLASIVLACLRFSLWTAPLGLLPLVMLRQSTTRATRREIAALHDPLTGLPNRSLLLSQLEHRLADRADPEEPIALLVLDLDHFKEINDSLGHPTGDELLRMVADRLRGAVRPEDSVARLGGDEFAVVAAGLTVNAATALAERLGSSLSEPFALDELKLTVAASVGIALAPQHASTADSMTRYAHVALYTAKETRGRAILYDPRFDANTVDRLILMGELQHGIDHGELVVYYQPKISTRTGRLRSVEALVRWRHPTQGLLPPDRFIPAAENTGLIEPLTRRVVDDALATIGHWRGLGLDLMVAVNISARHVANLDLPGQISAALARHGLPGSVLILEVTESCLMADPVRTRTVLQGLRDTGVRISIDDFGTGYSSFAHLRELPIDEIKIDRSFVSAAPRSRPDAAIVKSTVDLGRNLGLEVVAEGVETQECLDLLTEMGCDLVQGYFFTRPLPADELLAWASANAELPNRPRAH